MTDLHVATETEMEIETQRQKQKVKKDEEKMCLFVCLFALLLNTGCNRKP